MNDTGHGHDWAAPGEPPPAPPAAPSLPAPGVPNPPEMTPPVPPAQVPEPPPAGSPMPPVPPSGDVPGAAPAPPPGAPTLPPAGTPTLPPVGMPPAVAPPGMSTPSSPPSGPQFSFEGEQPSKKQRRSKAVVGGAVAGVLALGAAGVFAASQLRGGSDGGADTPEAVGTALMASIEQEDVLGMVDLLLPGERETFRDPLVDLVGEMSRLEVLSADATLSDLAGLDFDLTDETTSVTLTNVADIANIRMTGVLSASLDGEQLPIGDFITDLAGEDFDPASLDQPNEVSDFDLPMTVVEEDGRWYLSLFHTLAESIRGEFGDPIPETGLAPRGGDTPEGAVDAILDGVEQFDVGKIIAAINPHEAQALQRYAPMFLDDVDPLLADIPFSWQVTNTEYDVAGSGSKRSVSIRSLRIDGDAEGETFSIVIAGGCVLIEGGGERVDTCELQQGLPTVDDIFGDTSEIADITAEFEEVFADYEQPGLTVQQVDGQWFVSPIGSGFDQVLALLRALDRDEIDRMIETTTRLIDEVAGEFGDFTGFDELDDLGGLPGLDEPPTFEETVEPRPGEPVDEQAVPESDGSLGVPVDLDGDADLDDFEQQQQVAESCYEFADVVDVSACLRENVELGVLPSYYYTVELEFPECGVAEVSLGREPLYTMSDQDYTAMISTASLCFQALIESGAVDVLAVPPEYLKPSCGDGRNPWNFDQEDNDAVFDEWLTCVYE